VQGIGGASDQQNGREKERPCEGHGGDLRRRQRFRRRRRRRSEREATTTEEDFRGARGGAIAAEGIWEQGTASDGGEMDEATKFGCFCSWARIIDFNVARSPWAYLSTDVDCILTTYLPIYFQRKKKLIYQSGHLTMNG
jgi:hypothetical protein